MYAGASYLARQLVRYRFDAVRASGAYNVGPANVHKTAPWCLSMPNIKYVRRVFRSHRRLGPGFVRRHLSCPAGLTLTPKGKPWYHPLPKRILPLGPGSRYGARRWGRQLACGLSHCGVDLYTDEGTPVFAIYDGVVVKASRKNAPRSGIHVVIDHPGPARSIYCHLASIADGVRQGGKISAGQLLGRVGRSANLNSGTHLHLNMQVGHRYIDPEPFLKNAKLIGER